MFFKNVNHQMKKLLLSFSVSFISIFLFAQPKPVDKKNLKEPNIAKSSKPATNELAKLMMGIQLPYKMVNDTLAAIPYQGNNIANYNVVIQKIGDLIITYTNLSESVSNKITEAKYKYLLQQNDNFDIVKISLNAEENMIYVRSDVYKGGVTTAILQRIIKQVATVTDIISGELK